MGISCSKQAFADTKALAQNHGARKPSKSATGRQINIGGSKDHQRRVPPPLPPRNKKPRFSFSPSLDLKRAVGHRKSSADSDVKTRLLGSGSSSSKDTSSSSSSSSCSAVEELASVRDQGIVVLVRIRPTSHWEQERGQKCFLRVQGPTQLHVPASKSTPTEKTCTFDAVLPHTTTQNEVYQVAGPKLIQNLLQGFNATMIAYGQTGSGKTFTMEGTRQDPGVIPRLCRGLFEAIEALGTDKTVAVVASYVEIYNESVVDLLADASARSDTAGSGSPARRTSPRGRTGSNSVSPTVSPAGTGGGGPFSDGRGKPNIRESKDRGVYVENVVEQRVHSEAAVLALLSRGSSARTKGETQMNAASSRSHAVLTLSIKQTPFRDGQGPGGEGAAALEEEEDAGADVGTIRSKISLVDLAGSERAKSTGTAGQRLKEGAQINKSLSALGNVIKALTSSSGGNAHVPYRDSKLTRLLQDSLGGTAYTVVCCNVSPIEASEPETLSTLRFAERLKKVKNKMVVHMDPRSKEILALRRENAELRARIEELERGAMAAMRVHDTSSRDEAGNGARTSPRAPLQAAAGREETTRTFDDPRGTAAGTSTPPVTKSPPPVPPRRPAT
ncbi:unnamed protein product [Scytosiphon promiscuus]